MKKDFSKLTVRAEGVVCEKAAELFLDEIELRTGCRPETEGDAETEIRFVLSDAVPKDAYEIGLDEKALKFAASGLRGLIYAYSLFLRKSVFDGSRITLCTDISGKYRPAKAVRGHQCGYRSTPNTYDAWDVSDYRRFYLDIMAFGANMCEHIPQWTDSNRSPLMRYSSLEMAEKASAVAYELDLDVSCWIPNSDDEIDDEELALERRKKIFSLLPRLDRVFIPGGDPGSMDGDAFVERSIKISRLLKSIKPEASLWVSAQAPHSKPDWGERFFDGINKLPDEIDGLIMGPNHVFPLEKMRRETPSKYPVCFYPDITHCLRCEYPVHFDRDDWHFAFAAAFGRESVCPRPKEFSLLHKLTEPYVIGSVSYSEGVHDDVNKAVWSALDFDGNADLREIVEDYARLFMWQGDHKILAEAIFGLEMSWESDPALAPQTDSVLTLLEDQLERHPSLGDNWRFLLLLFRARCDKIVKERRLFESELTASAKKAIYRDEPETALRILNTPFDEGYIRLRRSVEPLAEKLFGLIGIQLDVEHYHTDNWERGATLDTIDRPVTDRAWLLKRFDIASKLPEEERKAYLRRVFGRNKTENGEAYFSVAENGLAEAGERQEGEFYMNVFADRPENDGRCPTCLFKRYDHYSFVCRLGGFADEDHKLRVTFAKTGRQTDGFYVRANGRLIHKGAFYGGERDEQFEKEMLPDDLITAVYDLPADVFDNGCLRLEWGEEKYGSEFCEFKIYKANDKEAESVK